MLTITHTHTQVHTRMLKYQLSQFKGLHVPVQQLPSLERKSVFAQAAAQSQQEAAIKQQQQQQHHHHHHQHHHHQSGNSRQKWSAFTSLFGSSKGGAGSKEESSKQKSPEPKLSPIATLRSSLTKAPQPHQHAPYPNTDSAHLGFCAPQGAAPQPSHAQPSHAQPINIHTTSDSAHSRHK